MGFRRWEHGIQWYPTKDAVIQAFPGPVLVGSAYEYTLGSKVKQARKYSGFASHWDYWDTIKDFQVAETPHNFNEVLPPESSRCLYFDIDGGSDFDVWHPHIVKWLRQYVWWFFSGERLDWSEPGPEAVVLRSADPSKYSCHIVFPEIQFKNHAQQLEYMTLLLSALPALKVQLSDGKKVPVLSAVVDRVPYMRFQLFRGPYACKLKDGELSEETQFVPENIFRSDPLTCFAGHVDRAYALDLPSPQKLLEWNEELRHFCETHAHRVAVSGSGGERAVNPQDLANLYDVTFQSHVSSGSLDLAGREALEVYEECLKLLHPQRASQFWSWFRISGVTYTMLQWNRENADARRRIWDAHFTWSSGYSEFCPDENVEYIEKCTNKRVSGLSLLRRLARFDNPDMRFRFFHDEPQDVHV